MNDPYPSRAQLRREALADGYLAEQAADVACFQYAVKALRDVVHNRSFGLGSPARGYDLVDIEGILEEWLETTPQDQLEGRASDRALDTA